MNSWIQSLRSGSRRLAGPDSGAWARTTRVAAPQSATAARSTASAGEGVAAWRDNSPSGALAHKRTKFRRAGAPHAGNENRARCGPPKRLPRIGSGAMRERTCAARILMASLDHQAGTLFGSRRAQARCTMTLGARCPGNIRSSGDRPDHDRHDAHYSCCPAAGRSQGARRAVGRHRHRLGAARVQLLGVGHRVARVRHAGGRVPRASSSSRPDIDHISVVEFRAAAARPHEHRVLGLVEPGDDRHGVVRRPEDQPAQALQLPAGVS